MCSRTWGPLEPGPEGNVVGEWDTSFFPALCVEVTGPTHPPLTISSRRFYAREILIFTMRFGFLLLWLNFLIFWFKGCLCAVCHKVKMVFWMTLEWIIIFVYARRKTTKSRLTHCSVTSRRCWRPYDVARSQIHLQPTQLISLGPVIPRPVQRINKVTDENV